MTHKETFHTFPDYRAANLPRILSSIDRDPFSPSFGCADRLYWGWKLIDYPDAALQRVALLLHLINHEKYTSEINAVFRFASKIQHRDGSFDQAFPNEHSHALSAFLLCDFTEICLGDHQLFVEYQEMLIHAGNYLIQHDEEHGFISNHLAGAATGLYKLFILTHDEKYKNRSNYYENRVLSRQSEEGWYLEYNGADPSYQTLCVYYLAQLYEMTKNETLWESLRKATDFVSYFAHPDGSFGGEYGSRNCEIIYPGGIALLAKYIPCAAPLLGWCISAYQGNRTVTPLSVDMQNLTPLFSNVLFAEFILKQNDILKIPEQKLPYENLDFERTFEEAGIDIRNSTEFYTVISWKKGGVIKSFNKSTNRVRLDDCGILLEKKGRMFGTTQMLSDLNIVERKSDRIKIKSPVFAIKRPLPDPFSFLILRFLNLTFWKLKWLRELGKKALVRFLMRQCTRLNYSIESEIIFQSNGEPLLTDKLIPGNPAISLLTGKKYSMMHMASSKYFYERSSI